jgi:hypothetical protein
VILIVVMSTRLRKKGHYFNPIIIYIEQNRFALCKILYMFGCALLLDNSIRDRTNTLAICLPAYLINNLLLPHLA